MTADNCKSDKNATGQLLDSLYLDMFHLIEEHTQCRLDIERTNASGAILLARTKFQQGGQSLSSAQIPTENSAEFNALCRVVDKTDDDKTDKVSIERHSVDKENGYVEPLHWFSVLPPMSLRTAVERFKKSIELVAESTNLQRELAKVLNGIDRLRRSLAL
ncbi:uncharacterized protein LOC132784799 [Drosophila nasuta]|uniref:Vacuolar ATPase assembly protein VMA22 n=1 Tax=Drosophila albomicans TaxID=7291 RepID=A0A6P8XKV1_DROAB|nr:uncharacterized protein LOC117574060 [Drosophila albomicans]XP_060646637.1 uncharacterized protein LOC132784799 [Drosophila nasuta]